MTDASGIAPPSTAALDPGTHRAGDARARDRWFFTIAAIAVSAIVFAGFARTYYLKAWFHTPALPWLLHLHGAVMTSWFLLFVVQARLIATHRIKMHRRLGVAGAMLAALVVVVVTAVIIETQRRAVRLGHPHLPGMAFQVGIVLVFATLVTAAIVLRRRSDVHKRVMLLACLSILSPGIVRIPLHAIHAGGLFSLIGILDACIIICAIIDALNQRRLHPAFVWGGLLIIVSQPLSMLLGATSAWKHVAGMLVS